MKYLNILVLLCGLSACAYRTDPKPQSVMFNEILEKYPMIGIGETKSANDIIYKYIQLGMTKQEVVQILTNMHHTIHNEENNQLYIGYYQVDQHPMLPKAGIGVYFKFNQEDKLESIDSEVRYYQ